MKRERIILERLCLFCDYWQGDWCEKQKDRIRKEEKACGSLKMALSLKEDEDYYYVFEKLEKTEDEKRLEKAQAKLF